MGLPRNPDTHNPDGPQSRHQNPDNPKIPAVQNPDSPKSRQSQNPDSPKSRQ